MGVGVHASVTVTNESLGDGVIKREISMYDRKDGEKGPENEKTGSSLGKSCVLVKQERVILLFC